MMPFTLITTNLPAAVGATGQSPLRIEKGDVECTMLWPILRIGCAT